jgi:hypothetical protein
VPAPYFAAISEHVNDEVGLFSSLVDDDPADVELSNSDD